jgi:hypothetical protein
MKNVGTEPNEISMPDGFEELMTLYRDVVSFEEACRQIAGQRLEQTMHFQAGVLQKALSAYRDLVRQLRIDSPAIPLEDRQKQSRQILADNAKRQLTFVGDAVRRYASVYGEWGLRQGLCQITDPRFRKWCERALMAEFGFLTQCMRQPEPKRWCRQVEAGQKPREWWQTDDEPEPWAA